MTLDKAAAVKGLNTWLGLVEQGVLKKNVAEVKTGDTVNEFKSGQVVFAINWGFAWDRFQSDKDSTVTSTGSSGRRFLRRRFRGADWLISILMVIQLYEFRTVIECLSPRR